VIGGSAAIDPFTHVAIAKRPSATADISKRRKSLLTSRFLPWRAPRFAAFAALDNLANGSLIV
jgi:hypothetical protein